MAASNPRHFYSDYTFSTDFCSFQTKAGNAEENPNMFYHPWNCYDHDIADSPVSVALFPHDQLFGVSDSMPEPKMSNHQYDYVMFDQPTYPMATDNWGSQGKTCLAKDEDPGVKVVRYSIEEKKERIMRYQKKRNQRNFNKTIKYACRKILADKRVRVRGRFAKTSHEFSCESDEMTTNSSDNSYEGNNSLYDDSFQMKCEDDYWLEAAIANLVHLPDNS